MRASALFLSSVLLAGLAAAQETTSTSALTITTSDRSIARQVIRMFESDAEVPDMGSGSVAVLSLDDGGQIIARSAEGSGWLRIDARPAQLMELFAAEVAQGRQGAQGMAGFILGQQGFGFEEIDQMVGAAFGFPKQLDALTIVIPTEYAPGEPMTVDVDIAPKAGTWLGTMVGNMQPLAAGVAMLPESGDPMVRVDANFDLAKVLPQLMPVLGVFSGMGQETKEGKAKAAAAMRRFYESSDGTMSMVFDMKNGGKALIGLSNADQIKALMADPDYLEISKLGAEANGMAEATIEPAAMTHRDVSVTRTRVVFDDPTMSPFGDDGTMETYAAVAGNLMVSTMFAGAKGEIQGLIDDTLDQKIKKVQLPANRLIAAKINVAALVDFMAQQGMPADSEGAPERMTADLNKTETGLKIQVKIQ